MLNRGESVYELKYYAKVKNKFIDVYLDEESY